MAHGDSIDLDQLKDETDPSPKLRVTLAENKRLNKRVDQLKLQLGKNEEYWDHVKEALQANEPLPITPYSPQTLDAIKHPLVATVNASDWHIGQIVDADEVDEFNAFDYEIAAARIEGYAKSVVDYTNIWRNGAKIRQCHILSYGDMISGDIHDELRRTNEWPVPVQIVKSAQIFAHLASILAQNFDSVVIDWVVADNHSRLLPRNQFDQGGLNSYNYTVGALVGEMLAKFPNVEFRLHAKVSARVVINETPYLVTHGHQIKSHGTRPHYGMDRHTAREAKARMNLPDTNFHKMIMGHFHEPDFYYWYAVNGSVSGTTAFDHALGRHAKPSQHMWFNHPVHGEIGYNCFWLDAFA
jgi:hypothetical protein